MVVAFGVSLEDYPLEQGSPNYGPEQVEGHSLETPALEHRRSNFITWNLSCLFMDILVNYYLMYVIKVVLETFPTLV